MAQDKAAEIIDFTAPHGAAANVDGETTGAFLASARLAAGLALEEVSEATKVKVAHLQAIEEMRADLLPPLPYTIGFIKVYARHLGLEAEAVAARFREELAAAAPAELDLRRAEQPLPAAGEGARLVSIFAIVAIMLFGIWVMMQIVGGGRDAGDAASRDSAPRVRLSDAPAVQPAPRPRLSAETGEETAAAETPAADEAESEIAEEGEPLSEETAPAVAEAGPETSRTEETPVGTAAPATPEIQERPPVRAEPVTPDVQEQPSAQQSEPAAEEQPRFLPRRPPPPSPAPVVVEAALVRSPAPAYPERCAREASAMESVTLMFDIDRNGGVANTRVASSTNDCFNAEALRTISRWRFDPRTVDGSPAAESGKSATLNFRR